MKFGKRHYRPQVDQMDCGVASLAMVFGYYGSYYFLAHLRELAKTTMDGTTALGLVKVAEEIGFETRAIKADMTLFDLPDLTFPFVAHVLKEGKLLHYYVVTGQDKDSIHIADPDPGVKLTKLPRERFEEEWTGVTLLWHLVQTISLIRNKKWSALFYPYISEAAWLDCQYRFGNTLGNRD